MDDYRIMMHKKEYEVYFGEGMPDRKTESRKRKIYPEELLDKKCGGCVRCILRDHAYKGKKAEGYHCTCQAYIIDISPDDKACVSYWDKAEEERLEKLHAEDVENRRKELWAIYEKRDPVKLPIVIDEYGGRIPKCPICGEMSYDTEQCYWCGQRFIQDKEIEEYNKPDEWLEDCPSCGGGGNIIAFAEELKNQGIDYQTRMEAVCQDIDIRAVYMTYVQCSYFGIPAVVYQSDTLRDPTGADSSTGRLYTPQYILNGSRR